MGRIIEEITGLGNKNTKKIYDDFHGLISITPSEIEIVDSPLFQRLRNIKQLGLAGFVFPGGTHNRFSHSLGVLSILHRLARQLDYFDDKPREVEKLRMAALLHDVGHLPLSHTIESVYQQEEKEKRKDLEGEPVIRGRDNITTGPIIANEQTLQGAFHERLGQFIIENTPVADGITSILKKLGFEPQEIGSIIVGAHQTPLYNQLINSDMDADQMDYLLRDAKNVGINYGSYETDYLISCMQCSNDPEKLIFYLSKKGINPAEYYLLAKYYYYTQILYHPKRDIYEIIATVLFQIAQEFRLAPRLEDLYNNITDDPAFFLFFDDYYFLKVVDKISDSREIAKKYPWASKFASCVKYRRHKDIIKLIKSNTVITEKRKNKEKGSESEAEKKRKDISQEGYVNYVTIDDINGKAILRKAVETEIAKSPEEAKDVEDFENAGLHHDYILIDVGGNLMPVNSCEASLIRPLSHNTIFLLREYSLDLE